MPVSTPSICGGRRAGPGRREEAGERTAARLCLTLPLSSSVTSRSCRSNPLPPGTRTYDSEGGQPSPGDPGRWEPATHTWPRDRNREARDVCDPPRLSCPVRTLTRTWQGDRSRDRSSAVPCSACGSRGSGRCRVPRARCQAEGCGRSRTPIHQHWDTARDDISGETRHQTDRPRATHKEKPGEGPPDLISRLPSVVESGLRGTQLQNFL